MKRINNLYKAGLAGMIAIGLTMGASAQRHEGGRNNGGGGGERPSGNVNRPQQQERPRAEQPRQSAPVAQERHEITRPQREPNNFPGNTRPATPRTETPRTAPVANQAPAQPRPNFPAQQPVAARHEVPVERNNNSRDYRPANNSQSNFRPVNNAGRNYNNRVYTEHERAWGYAYNHYDRRPIVVNRFYYGGGYHPHPYYYRPFTPRWGIHINILPIGYYPFYYGSNRFYYNDGIFYQPYGGYYETVEPPLGAYIPVIPSAATVIVINGRNYYEHNGTYYERVFDNSQPYQVVGVNGYLKDDLAPATEDDGDIISDAGVAVAPAAPASLSVLPENYKTVTLSNVTYYVSPAGEYYTKNIDENGKITYVQAAAQTGGQ